MKWTTLSILFLFPLFLYGNNEGENTPHTVEESDRESELQEGRFNYDLSDYPSVIYVPLENYRSGDPEYESNSIRPAIFNTLRDHNEAINFKDWTSLLKNPLFNPDQGPRMIDSVRYFIAYTYHYDPETGVCTVNLLVFDGLPYDPSRPPVTEVRGISETEENSEGMCLGDAARDAARQLIRQGLFDPGYERRPPRHFR